MEIFSGYIGKTILRYLLKNLFALVAYPFVSNRILFSLLPFSIYYILHLCVNETYNITQNTNLNLKFCKKLCLPGPTVQTPRFQSL